MKQFDFFECFNAVSYNKIMNPEQPQQIEPPYFDKNFAVVNLIQRDLIEKSGEDPIGWVDEYAADFREIIEENPKLLQLYEKNPGALENFILQQLQNRKKTIH